MGAAVGAIGSVVGGLVGGIGGAAITTRTAHESDRALTNDSLRNDYTSLEQILLPYDDLRKNGLAAVGDRAYFGGGSRLGTALSGYESSLFQADPTVKQWGQVVGDRLKGAENGGIPDDLRRSITENLRSSQASRGIIDSNTAATEEVVRLMGGQEAITNQRLSEAQNYFQSVLQPGLQSVLPNLGQLYGGELQRTLAKAGNRVKAGEIGASFAS